MDPKQVFTDIYARQVWGNGSGGGSAPEVARPYVDFVNAYIQEHKPRTILDVGCGDMVVARMLKLNGAKYIGVEAAQLYYEDAEWPEGMTVVGGVDMLKDPLPRADLLLCKEVLQHLSNAQVKAFIKRTKAYPRMIFTSGTEGQVNADIVMGECRPVDLSLPPFSTSAKTVLRYGKVASYIVQEIIT